MVPVGIVVILSFNKHMLAIRQVARAALHLILPPLCSSCQTPVSTPHAFCHTCWGAMQRIDGAVCVQCGIPFPSPVLEGEKCIHCSADEPAYTHVRAAATYDDLSRALVLRLKHADQTDLIPSLGQLMLSCGASLLMQADLLVPVPLHYTRLIRRQFNQSALLARWLAEKTNKAVATQILVRHRATKTQGHKKRAERFKNVRDAFSVHEQAPPLIKNKNILLIDDVMTTGATLHECAKTLLQAGALGVNGLVLARVALAE